MIDTPRTDEQIATLVIEAGSFRSMYYEALDYWNTMSEFARTLERELSAEKARGDRLEKALRAIANDDDEEFVTPVHIIRETARAALGDSK